MYGGCGRDKKFAYRMYERNNALKERGDNSEGKENMADRKQKKCKQNATRRSERVRNQQTAVFVYRERRPGRDRPDGKKNRRRTRIRVAAVL